MDGTIGERDSLLDVTRVRMLRANARGIVLLRNVVPLSFPWNPAWTSIIRGECKYAFGMRAFPTRESKHLTYMQSVPMCSPATSDPECVIDAVDIEVVQVAIAAHYGHTENPEIKIQPRDDPDDAPSGVQYSATVRDVTKTMVWTRCAQTCAVPTHLRGASDQCLVYRRIIKDAEDNNKILDDGFAILYTAEHFARKLRDEPH
jgi:hypothetical protein